MTAPDHPTPSALPAAAPEQHAKVTAMIELFAAAQADAEALLVALRAERDALTGRDPGLLEQAVAGKTTLVAALEAHEAQRATLAGGNTDLWHQSLSPAEQSLLLEPRSNLRDVLASCRELNGINGRVLNRSRQSTRELLDLMHGNRGTSSTYGADGDHSPGRAGQSLAKA